MQQQAGPVCQYNSFILSGTHHKSAVPVRFTYIKADIHSCILITASFSVMVGHIQWLTADHISIRQQHGPSLVVTFMTTAN